LQYLLALLSLSAAARVQDQGLRSINQKTRGWIQGSWGNSTQVYMTECTKVHSFMSQTTSTSSALRQGAAVCLAASLPVHVLLMCACRTPAHCIEYAHLIKWSHERQEEEFDADNEEHMTWIYTNALERAKQYGIEVRVRCEQYSRPGTGLACRHSGSVVRLLQQHSTGGLPHRQHAMGCGCNKCAQLCAVVAFWS
jgi:hypothetical protein